MKMIWNQSVTGGDRVRRKKDTTLNFNSGPTNKSLCKISPLLRLNSEGEITGTALCDNSSGFKRPLCHSHSFNSYTTCEGSYPSDSSKLTSKVTIPPLKKSASVPGPVHVRNHQPSMPPVSGMKFKKGSAVCPMMDKLGPFLSGPAHLGSADIFGTSHYTYCNNNSSTSSSDFTSKISPEEIQCNLSEIELQQLMPKCNNKNMVHSRNKSPVELEAAVRSECLSCGNERMNSHMDKAVNVNCVNKLSERSTTNLSKQQQEGSNPIAVPKAKRKRRRRKKSSKKKQQTTASTSGSPGFSAVSKSVANTEQDLEVKDDNSSNPSSLLEPCLIEVSDASDPGSSSTTMAIFTCAVTDSSDDDDDLIFEESSPKNKKLTKENSKPKSKRGKGSMPSSKIQLCLASDSESEVDEKDCSAISGLIFTLSMSVSEDEDNDSSVDWESLASPSDHCCAFEFEEFSTGLSMDSILGCNRADAMSQELRNVNAKWNKVYKVASNGSKPSVDPKVHFAMDDDLTTVYIVGNESREGEWHLYARERTRFQDRVKDMEAIIAPVLCASHRVKVLERLQA